MNKRASFLSVLALCCCMALFLASCGGGGGGGSAFAKPSDGNGGGGSGGGTEGTLKWSTNIDSPTGIGISSPFTPTFVSSPAIAPDGTIYGGSTDHFLYALNPDGTVKWRFETGGDLYASPAIGDDGTIYIGSADRQFYAINPDGTLKWIFPTKTVLTSSAAIGADGTIYAAGTNQDKTIFGCGDTAEIAQLSTLFAMNPDGTEKWEFLVNKSGFFGLSGLSGVANSSPALSSDGKTLYIGSEGDFVFDRFNICDPDSCYPPSDAILACPGRPVNGHVYAINTADGSLKWDFKTCGAADSSPAIGADGTVYIGSKPPRKFFGGSCVVDESSTTTGFIYAIIDNGTIGTLKCIKDLLGDVDSSPAVGVDGTIYVGSDDFHVWALPPVCPFPTQWPEKWVQPTKEKVKSSPAIAADGTIFIGSNDNSLYAFAPDGTQILRFIVGENVNSGPSIGTDGTIYFTSEDGRLHALFGTRGNGLAESSWPKFRHDLRNLGRQQ